jgi:hypothetical protein
VTFYPSEDSEDGSPAVESNNNSAQQDHEEKISFKDTENGPNAYKGDSFNIPLDNTKYETDFFPGKASTQSKLIKNGDYIVVTKREFIAKPKEDTKVVITERTIDQLINEISEKANSNGPYKNSTKEENKNPSSKETFVQKNQVAEKNKEDEQSKLIQLANELSMSAYELESNINELISDEMKKNRSIESF